MKSCGSSKTWTNPGSSHSISYFFEADGFCFAHTALYSLHTSPQIPTHRLDTEAEKKKKKNDGHSDDDDGGGGDEEGDEENEKKIALFRESL